MSFADVSSRYGFDEGAVFEPSEGGAPVEVLARATAVFALGQLEEFNQLVSQVPAANTAWGQIESQLTSEGADLADIVTAKSGFAEAFDQLSSQYGVGGDEAIQAAQSYIMTGKTVLGAVNTLNGLVQALGSNDPAVIATAVQSFTGTMIGFGVALGVISTPVGAAIVAGVGELLSILDQVGLFGKSPQTVGEICGFPYRVKPDFVVGCLGAWGSQVAPGANGWRSFPDPNNPADAPWFVAGQVGPGRWNGLFVGALGPDMPQDYSANGIANPASPTERPIDVAFASYYAIEALAADTSFPMTDFAVAWIAAWKRNAEYVLNGGQAQDDWLVLSHLVKTWNKAHAQGTTLIVHADPNGTQLEQASYDAVNNHLEHTDPIIASDKSGLILYNGPALATKHLTLHLHPTASAPAPAAAAASSGGSVAGAAVAGTALAGGVLWLTLGAPLTVTAVTKALGAAWARVTEAL